jgi:hypothetical protein
MVVAMVAMRMMQVAVHQIICMISVRDRFVPTVRAVDMLLGMACCVTIAGAPVRVFGIYFDGMFSYSVGLLML